MRILITGGTGFIGRALCPALLDAGHSLTIYSRYSGRANAIFGNQVVALSSINKLTKSYEFDAIINLAGAPIFGELWSDERKKTLLQSRINITQDLMQFISRAEIKPEVLLSGSAIGFYGDQGDTVLDESSAASGDDFGQQLCAQWEDEAEHAKQHGVRVCQLRTGLVIGKNGGLLQSMLPAFKFGLGGRLGDGMQWMPWIHIADHVAICQTLLENKELAGKFNLTAPNPVTNQDFSRTLAQVLNRPSFTFVPRWVLKMLLGEMSQLLLGSQRVIPKRILDAGFQFQFKELEPALRDILQK